MQRIRVVYRGISHESLVFSGIHTSLNTSDDWDIPQLYHEKVLHNYFIPCHRKYSGQQGQHDQCETRADLNGLMSTLFTAFLDFFNFLLIVIHDQITSNSVWLQNWRRVKNLAPKAQTTVERNWRESQRTMGRLSVIQLNCNDRWEGWVEYWRIYNGFPAFWLAVFSMAWYKVIYPIVRALNWEQAAKILLR